ncbi:LysR substrate-binding domain-containing protein [Actinomadura hibisca]|uniref:LysR substrate-binding domain-containing protein n=1 Tax=Actinomadura hibisca TaxID=68565 RepID=UPI00082C038D|nr:LysR substrate-binding domain-containing protein [Actinomadura hibisca]
MSWNDLPPLGPLVAFEATMRHGSVSKAAAELHLTHGAVSRQIQQLERALGVALFERRNRAVVPTAAARTFVQSVDDALNLLSAAARQARAATQPVPLVLSCEPTLLMRWLIPRLPALTSAVPGLNLHLVASGGPVAFDRESIDVAIRRNDFEIPGDLTTFELFDEWVGPVCTPELARGLSGPEDLAHVPRLHTSTRPSAWADWAEHYPTPLPPAPEQTFEHFYLSLQAAASGLGVAIGPRALVHDDLEAGQLTAPFGFRRDGSAYLLMTRLPAEDDRVTALVSWLREQARTDA